MSKSAGVLSQRVRTVVTELAFFILMCPSLYALEDVIATVDYSIPDGTSQFSIGVTHTQPDWEEGNPQAATRAKALLSSGLRYQNQHLMDWGAENPEPKPGVYNWDRLDKRIALIRSMVLLWDAELQDWNYLFTSTKTADGGQPSPHYQVVKTFNSYFGPGTQLYKASSSSAEVEVLASATYTLLINKKDAEIKVQVNDQRLILAPYEVHLLRR